MIDAYIDTDVLIRLLTGDDPDKQRRARDLFERVQLGTVTVAAPHTVIADAVYVLHSKELYDKPKSEVAELLLPLVQLPGFRLARRQAIIAALQLYAAVPRLDLGDALIVAFMQRAGPPTVFSYDSDYEGIPGVTRMEP
jgi:predicted nucleic acid-binding protein